MIFANGDTAITCQIEPTEVERLLATYKKDGKLTDSPYITAVQFTKNTVTFHYEPIEVMENENTIEPSTFVTTIVKSVLNRESEVK